MKLYKPLLFTAVIIIYSCGKKIAETKPIRKDITETVFASGVLEANNTYNLTAQTDGYLINISFEEGDLVAAGQVLAVIDNKENRFNTQSAEQLFKIAESNIKPNAPALQQALSNIELNKLKLKQDELLYERYQQLQRENSVSQLDFENIKLQLESSKTNYKTALENYKILQTQAIQTSISNKALMEINENALRNNNIKAVLSGKVYRKYKEIGDYVKRGDIIAQIGESNNIYAKINVDESNIRKISLGQVALVRLNTDEKKTYTGKVSEIYPAFEESSQSFLCKITLPSLPSNAIVNTQLQANIIISETKNALVIPRNYLDFGGYVQEKDKKNKTKIKTRFISTEWVQIIEGINESSVLITENIAENNVKTSELGSQLK